MSMIHAGTQEIETARCSLRQFRVEDAEAMFRNWASDEEVTKYLTWPAHRNVAETKELLREWVKTYSDPSVYNWAILSKEKQEAVGNISVVSVNEKAARLTIGYCLSEELWGQGLMTECLKAVIDYLFENTSVNRIDSYHDTDNPASGKVMRKAGLKEEATLKEFDHNNQGICDVTLHALLRSEWNRGCCR